MSSYPSDGVCSTVTQFRDVYQSSFYTWAALIAETRNQPTFVKHVHQRKVITKLLNPFITNL